MTTAIRWVIDLLRGAMAAAGLRDKLQEYLDASGPLESCQRDHVDGLLKVLAEDCASPGAWGRGARLSVSPRELIDLRWRAQERQAEACSIEISTRAEA